MREAEPLGNGFLRGVFGSDDYFVMASMTEKNRLPVAVGAVRSPRCNGTPDAGRAAPVEGRN
ncbi:hypothetical protein BHK69_06555 [Bosea vaviloviae]|uniref:Uncharacterized protein n=1 Tax=Bosea vaviloviae TaxID=1526658 RepID=A0A1D7TYH8_9HYPH|nr:hypothetical protein BHK69_06555 [Bosea vaviloviae]